MSSRFQQCADLIQRLTEAIHTLQQVVKKFDLQAVEELEWYELLQQKLRPQLGNDSFLVVAVVGGTNIGKSVTFNHIAGGRLSATSPMASGTKHPTALLPEGFEECNSLKELFPGFDILPWSDVDQALQEDERHLLFHSTVISAAERESAYVIDGLMHNDVVQSDIHSTDTHGYTEAIFAAMHLLGFSYAPRIKNLKRQRLYLFKSRQNTDRSWWALKPSGYINTELIEDNWDDVLRFIATIKLKETTASDLFRRLNSYSKQHVLYRALRAFGRIIKSMFILRYIDDVDLRQAIERQLNKIESSHRFSRAISVGNPREMVQTEKEEQEIAEACKRIIKNAIVCWNYLYLTQRIADERDPDARETLLDTVVAGSVVSWQHINLLGEYDFSDEKLQDSVGIKHPKILAAESFGSWGE